MKQFKRNQAWAFLLSSSMLLSQATPILATESVQGISESEQIFQVVKEVQEVETATLSTSGTLSYEDFRKAFFAGMTNTVKTPSVTASSTFQTTQSESTLISVPEKEQPQMLPPILPELELVPMDDTISTTWSSTVTNNTNYGYGDEETAKRRFVINTTNEGAIVDAQLVAQGEHCNIWWVDPAAEIYGVNDYWSESAIADSSYSSSTKSPDLSPDSGQNTNSVAVEIAKNIDVIYKKMTDEIAEHSNITVGAGFRISLLLVTWTVTAE